jgi:hypothetical protein
VTAFEGTSKKYGLVKIVAKINLTKFWQCQNFGKVVILLKFYSRISYVLIKFGNKLNITFFLATLPKNGMVENSINR